MPNTAHALKRLSGAIAFVEKNLPEKLTLERIAVAAFCSKYHFHRLFARSMGMTLHCYLQRRRLTEAARALVFSRTPILHIALETGYESQQAFATVFKAMYKVTPGRFRDQAAYYPLQLPAEPEYPLHGEAGALSAVRRATHADIPAWMHLVRQVVDGFPCLSEAEYVPALRAAIAGGRAFRIPDGGPVAGAMIVSPDGAGVEFLAVHPLYRDAGLTEALVAQALHGVPDDAPGLGITSYREGDKADTGHRNALIRLGFTPAETLVEYGYPTQKLVLKRSDHQRRRKR